LPAITGAAIGIPSLAARVGAFASKFAGPLLSFGSKLFGSGGDRSNLERHAIARRVRDAQEAGIHPLFALGSSVGYSPQFSTGSALGDGLAAGGDLFRDIRSEEEAKSASGIAAADRELTRRLVEAQIRGANASASRDEVAAQVALSEAALNEQAAAAQLRDRIAARLDDAMVHYPGAFGTFPLPLAPAMRQVVSPEGKVGWVPNQDVMETGELLGAGATIAGGGMTLWDTLRSYFRPFGSRRKKRARPSSDGWEKAGVIHKIQR